MSTPFFFDAIITTYCRSPGGGCGSTGVLLFHQTPCNKDVNKVGATFIFYDVVPIFSVMAILGSSWHVKD